MTEVLPDPFAGPPKVQHRPPSPGYETRWCPACEVEWSAKFHSTDWLCFNCQQIGERKRG